jgi:uncharacterized protein with FMN-binding domain
MIPKRAIGALLTTVLALALLLTFRTPESLPLAGSDSADTAIVGSPSPSTTATTPPTGGTEPTAASTYIDGTVTGPVVSNRYGDVQVQVTISGGAITDVTALQLPDVDNRSRRIASSAEPILREEALTAQSANIDLLSGATYTSEAYAQSLQSALDQVRA